LILFLCFFCYNALVAKNDIEEIKKNLPKMLGASNAGTEFYFTFHPCWESEGQRNELKVYVSSGIETKVTLELVGKGYKKTQLTKANDIIEFSLSPVIGQCYQKSDQFPPEPEQVYTDYAIHLYSEAPIICYGVTRYTRTSVVFR